MNVLKSDIINGVVENKIVESMMQGLDSCVIYMEKYNQLNMTEIQECIIKLKQLYPDFQIKQMQYKDNYVLMMLWQPVCCQLF